MEVLVLNAAYQPIGITTWQKAYIKLYAKKAAERVEIVCAYPNKKIKSAHAEHPMPCVVRYIKYRHMKKKGIKFSRDNVWARDRGRCQYCNMQVPRQTCTYDHVLPKSRGGKTTWENIVIACSGCNTKKRDMTPTESHMKLKSVPARPDYLPEEFKASLRFRRWMPDEWKAFFGQGYWHGGEGQAEPDDDDGKVDLPDID